MDDRRKTRVGSSARSAPVKLHRMIYSELVKTDLSVSVLLGVITCILLSGGIALIAHFGTAKYYVQDLVLIGGILVAIGIIFLILFISNLSKFFMFYIQKNKRVDPGVEGTFVNKEPPKPAPAVAPQPRDSMKGLSASELIVSSDELDGQRTPSPASLYDENNISTYKKHSKRKVSPSPMVTVPNYIGKDPTSSVMPELVSKLLEEDAQDNRQNMSLAIKEAIELTDAKDKGQRKKVKYADQDSKNDSIDNVVENKTRSKSKNRKSLSGKNDNAIHPDDDSSKVPSDSKIDALGLTILKDSNLDKTSSEVGEARAISNNSDLLLLCDDVLSLDGSKNDPPQQEGVRKDGGEHRKSVSSATGLYDDDVVSSDWTILHREDSSGLLAMRKLPETGPDKHSTDL